MAIPECSSLNAQGGRTNFEGDGRKTRAPFKAGFAKRFNGGGNAD
jgi:hypothetical protein